MERRKTFFSFPNWVRRYSNYNNGNLYTVCVIDKSYTNIYYQDICYDAFIGHIGVSDEWSIYNGIRVEDHVILFNGYDSIKSDDNYNEFIVKYVRYVKIRGPIIIVRH